MVQEMFWIRKNTQWHYTYILFFSLVGIKFALQGLGRVQWDESKSYTKGTSSNLSHKNMEVYLDEVMIMHRGKSVMCSSEEV